MSFQRARTARVVAPDKLEIHLTENEQSICDLLEGCTAYLQDEMGISTSCRIAGGWVRDKLLGSQSNDIDVALSNMMGVPFAQHLTSFGHAKGINLGPITKIEQNPDQSKHLETATLKVFGLDIDLVNLRSEEYAETSRIPTDVSFGTPLQDALRRDMTINSLFYNIHTRQVEDFTEQGLDDLRNGIIRTPLPPRETFLDDPLRILRCVRFASRFGFDVVPALKEAVLDPTIQRALVSKVTRERVGDEISKMLLCRDPLYAFELIQELSLYTAIFYVIPSAHKSDIPEPSAQSRKEALAAATILHSLLLAESVSGLLSLHPYLMSVAQQDASAMARLYLASILIPYLSLSYQDSKRKSQLAVELVIRESLKVGTQNHYLDGIPKLFSALPVIQQHLKDHLTHPLSRSQMGLFIRNKLLHNPSTGSHWTTSLIFSLVSDLISHYNFSTNALNVDDASRAIGAYNSLLESIVELQLPAEVDTKPLLTGHDIITAFGLSKAGPWVGRVLEDVVEWQLEHPGKTKAQCLEWLNLRGPGHYMSNEDNKPASKRPRTK